jgi:peptide-methionine (S)-S-oxide reductase
MSDKQNMVASEQALAGREQPLELNQANPISGLAVNVDAESGQSIAYFGMGCFWGAERLFWQQAGVVHTAVGYAGGFTPNPSYTEVCSAQTGHAEVVIVVFDPLVISYVKLVEIFFENHDPTQGMRQGGDVGTQYRSMILFVDAQQQQQAQALAGAFQRVLSEADKGAMTTEIEAFTGFNFAELEHQQYLHKNPEGYCGLGGTGICMPPSLNR